MVIKKHMKISDPEPITSESSASAEETSVNNGINDGFSITFIVGAVLALFIILGYPFFLMGKWLYSGILALGYTQITAFYLVSIIAVLYFLAILLFCIISRKSKDLKKRKKAKLYVRITAVIIPTISVGVHIWRYFLAYTSDKNIEINTINAGVMTLLTILIGFLFWKMTTRFLLPTAK